MHARMEFVRQGCRPAGRLPAAERSHHRGAVCEVARSDHRAHRRSRHDRRRRAGDLVQWRHGDLRRPDRGVAARAGQRSAARDRAHHRWLRRAQPGEAGGRARRGAVGARRGVRDRRRRRRRHLAERRARAQADRAARPAGGCSFRHGNRNCLPCTSTSRRMCSSATCSATRREPGRRRGLAAHHGADDRCVAPHPHARRLLRAEAAAGPAVARVHGDRRQSRARRSDARRSRGARRRRRPEGGHLPGGRGAGLGRARARCQRQHDQGRRRGQDRGAVVRRGAEAGGCPQRAAVLRLRRRSRTT